MGDATIVRDNETFMVATTYLAECLIWDRHNVEFSSTDEDWPACLSFPGRQC